MFFRLRLPRKYRLTVTLAQIEEVIGVNSTVADDVHILMWDFDNCPYSLVYDTMQGIQTHYKLPDIQLFRTRPDADNFHAYCLKLTDWRDVVAIIASTEHVDYGFLKWGIHRGYFTLRIGPKSGAMPYQVAMIPGSGPGDIKWRDLPSYVKYETLRSKRGTA